MAFQMWESPPFRAGRMSKMELPMTRSRSLALSVCLAAALVLSETALAHLSPSQMQAAIWSKGN